MALRLENGTPKSKDEIEKYFEEERELLESTKAVLDEKANVESSFLNEKELINRILWAKSRLNPVSSGSRKVQIIEPALPPSALKKQ